MQNSETPGARVFLLESDPLRIVGFKALLEPHGLRIAAGDIDQWSGEAVLIMSTQASGDALEKLAKLQQHGISARTLVVGPKASDELVLEAIAAGAKGYVEESSDSKIVAEAIGVVQGGSIWAPRRVLAAFVERESVANRQKTAFTPREEMVLRLLVAGRTNKEIGQELKIEERTVKAHVGKLMRKVGVQNRIALSVHAVTRALLK